MDEDFMKEALHEAEKAYLIGEVPVGAVIVLKGEIIARGHNLRETSSDPTAHAEIIALRKAADVIKHWRLSEMTIYVTLEPCVMCAGALIQARLKRLVYGADDPKAGAVKTLYNITQDPRLNHRLEVTGGVLAEDCAAILQRFFHEKREQKEY